MSYYRETFGHRPGEFPVCEDVAARSIALPVLPRDDRGPGRARRRSASRRARRRALVRSRLLIMSRFSEPQHEAFRRLNDSIGFDWRLAPYDIEQSRAHAAMLDAQGIISAEDRAALDDALEQVHGELSDGSFPFADGDEDIHMAIERRVTELAGRAGGRLHTARSRNDQVATDVAMFVRAHAYDAATSIARLATVVIDVAERHLDWPMPGYTHLQRAQPVYLSHHLLAYVMDVRAGPAALPRCRRGDGCPAARRGGARGRQLRHRPPVGRCGARVRRGGAELDRRGLEPRLRTRLPLCRGYVRDASVASRGGDRAVVLGGVPLLRGVRRVGSGSSIMPQKKNPDAAELLRAKAPRLSAHLVGLHGVMHGLRSPTTRTCRRTRSTCSTRPTRSSCRSPRPRG